MVAGGALPAESMSRMLMDPCACCLIVARMCYVPEEDPQLFAEARMKYSLAYKGGYEAADRANFDTWTYPADTGAQVLKEAFDRVTARPM